MELFAQCLQCDHTSKCKDQSGSIQFELTCSVNTDCSTPNQPKLDRQSLVVWFDLEQSLTWCKCMASRAKIELVQVDYFGHGV